MTGSRRTHLLGLALVTAAAVAWSTSGLFTRHLALDAATILFWRGLFGALGTLLVMACLGGQSGLSGFRHLGRPGLAYAVLTAVSMHFFISALLLTTVAHVAILTAIVPFVAGLLGWLVLGTAPDRSAVLASGCALAGVIVMVGLGVEGRLSGDALALLMTVCMAGMILVSRRHPGIPALAATCLASTLSALVVMPFADLTISLPDGITLALFALVNQVLGFGLFALGARLLAPMESALLTTLDAPLAPLWVWLFLAETPSAATLAGGAVILASVTGHILLQSRTNRPGLT